MELKQHHYHHHRSPPSIKRKKSDTLKHLKNLPIREFQKLSPLPKFNCGAKLNKHGSTVTAATTISESKKFSRSKQCFKKIARTFDGQQFYPDSDYEDDEVEKKTIGQPLKDYNGLNGQMDDKRNFGRNNIDDPNGQHSLKETEIWHLNETATNNKIDNQSPNEILSPATLSCRSASKHGQGASSKCACTSCKQQQTTNSKTNDNQNKTKSVGTQHDANSAYDPWIRQTSSHSNGGNRSKSNHISISKAIKSINSNTNAKVIVITDDFKAKALNQEVVIDTKRNILRYMKANRMAKTNSSRSMDDVRISTDEPDIHQIGKQNELNSNQIAKDSSIKSINRDDLNTIDKQKAISKSVDNVSQLSGELAPLDNVGSVELIFISDEYLNRAANQDVIILKNNSKTINNSNARKLKQQQLNSRNSANNEKSNSAGAGNSSSENGSTSANASKTATTTIITTGRQKLVQNELHSPSNKSNGHANDEINVNDEKKNAGKQQNINENGNSNPENDGTDPNNGHSEQIKTKKSKLNRQSSAETSIDDVNNKITTCAFQSYDEDPEHLERKDIQSEQTQIDDISV